MIAILLKLGKLLKFLFPAFILDTTKSEITESSNTDVNDLIKKPSTLEERRKSLLDHHWAIPNKDRLVLGGFFFEKIRLKSDTKLCSLMI